MSAALAGIQIMEDAHANADAEIRTIPIPDPGQDDEPPALVSDEEDPEPEREAPAAPEGQEEPDDVAAPELDSEPQPETEPQPQPEPEPEQNAVTTVYPVRARDLNPSEWEVGVVREDGDRHVAPLLAPPLVLLPRASLKLDSQGYATVTLLDARDAEAFARAEEWALKLAARSSTEWFGRDISEESLKTAFRTCCISGTPQMLKVDVEDAAAFDASENPEDLELLARGGEEDLEVVLELRRLRFGSTAFGAQWSLLQAQKAPPPRPSRRPIPTRKPLADWVD